MPAKGTTALYRPVPTDFDETFIRVGWTSIEIITRAHAKTIKKWLDLRNRARAGDGRSTLQEARAAWVARHGPAQNPARAHYVLSRVRKRRRDRITTVVSEDIRIDRVDDLVDAGEAA